jgi:phosphate starvation-inducible protein PhoH
LEQFDRHKDKTQTGLWDALKKFNNVDDIGVFEFKSSDIVRNPLISKILEKYEE